LESVKVGEMLVTTDRGRPAALIVPIAPGISEDKKRTELRAKALVRPASGPIPPGFVEGAVARRAYFRARSRP